MVDTKQSTKTTWSISTNDLLYRSKKPQLKFLMEECTSFRSAPRQASVDFFECNSAMDYVAALIVLSVHYDRRNQIMIEPFLTKAARAAYYNNYSGKWIVVKELLNCKTYCLNNCLQKLPEFFAPEEFYGNLIPLMKRMNKSIRFRNWHNRPMTPVKRPQRPRGYTDKGTSTPLHEKLLGKSDSVRLSQKERIRHERIGGFPRIYTPPEQHLFDKRIERNQNYQKLSSLYDELFNVKEELYNVEKSEQTIRAAIRRVAKQLKISTRRNREKEEELRVSRTESRREN